MHYADRMDDSGGISIVVPTFNRATRLEVLLRSLIRLDPPRSRVEIIVADNGSTDRTADVVREFARQSPLPVRHLLEPRRGVAYARNAAVAASSCAVIAFTDDDQDVAPEWLTAIERTFDGNPDVDVIGGRVLPRWLDGEPDGLTHEQWGPLSIIDRGLQPFRLSRARWMCLPGGNMAWRRGALIARGGFAVQYSRTEDRELLVRHLLAGGSAMYVPAMVVYHHVDRGRLTRAFFRSWHRAEGRMRAGYAFEELFDEDGGLRWPRPETPRLLGVSRYLYREWVHVLGEYLRARARGSSADAMRHEGRLLAVSAYLRRRIEHTATPDAPLVHRAGPRAARAAARTAAMLGVLG
jgi:glycosyltransferase involved in cell wall biosynthesis